MMTRSRSDRLARVVRIALGAVVLGYGVYIAEPGAPRLMAFGLTLFALPLLFQFSPWPLARSYALWFGAFLVLQSVMTPILLGDALYLVLHPPNVTRTTIYPDGVFPGFSGTQRVTLDERGFRVNPRVDYERKTGIRIFAIGGSTTEEMLIDDEKTWTHRLQAALVKDLGKPIEVINIGVSGTRTRQHIAALKHILPLQPDIVLFLVGINDWHFDILSRFGSNRIVDRLVFPDTLLGRFARARYNRLFRPATEAIVGTEVATGNWPPRRSFEPEQKISWFPETASDQYRANLLRLSDICRESRITCIFLTQPNAYAENVPQNLKDLFWMTPWDAPYTLTLDSLIHIARLYNRTLVDFANARGHPLCDVAAHLEPTLENFYDESHFTLAGSARVAEIVTGCVKPVVAQVR